MGFKSRGNWQLGYCMRHDCSNRDVRCDSCFRFNEYKRKEVNSGRDSGTSERDLQDK